MSRPANYVTRSQLGWGPSPAANGTPRQGLVIHYDSSNMRLDTKPHSECIAYWKRTRNFHTGPQRGWADIGYSFMACPHDYILEGRGLNKQQAAQPGGNATHYSVTLAGGPSDPVTAGSINAVRRLRQWLMSTQNINGRVLGHRDFSSTSCPGQTAYNLVRNGTFGGSPGTPAPGNGGGGGVRSMSAIQRAVNEMGYTPALDVDGINGPKTQAGVRWLQGRLGVTADGVWGPATEAAYIAYMEDDMPERRYLSTSSGTRLRRNEWTQIQLGDPNEWSLAGISSSAQRFIAEVGWRIEGLNEGDEYQVRLCNYDPPSGSGSWVEANGRRIGEYFHGTGDAWGSHTFVGQVTGEQRVRVQIKQWTSDDARVVSTNSDTFTWDV